MKDLHIHRVKSKRFRSNLIRHGRIALVCLLSLYMWAQQKYDISDALDVLSVFHTESPGLKNCDKCHNDDLEVQPAKCLTCHREIALRISEERGYHRDKGEECSVCHAEHQGKDAQLVLLDPEDFDHEETGTLLLESHEKIKDCRQCHRENNTIPRNKFRSYLFKDTGCQICHTSPHPGCQEKCLTCHSQKNWEVDIWNPGGFEW